MELTFIGTATTLLRLGTFIKYIPYPVTVGFTAGIAASSGGSASAA